MLQTYKLEPGPITLYAQLAGILRERIKSGAWPHGSEIPSLDELAQQFNVARVTARLAMQMLAKEGLVFSHRGRRSVVTYASAPDVTPLFMSIDLISPTTPAYQITILSLEEVSAEQLGEPFSGVSSGQYMCLRKTDAEGGMPYSTSTHFIALPVFRQFPKGAEKDVKIARLMRDHTLGILTECGDRVSVGAAEVEEAQQLECPLSAPVARIRRIFMDGDQNILYYAQLTFRGDRFGIERDITSMILG